MPDAESSTPLLAPTPEALSLVKVFPLIPSLKRSITEAIDSPLSWDQLTASDINFAIVRPLVFKYARLKNMSIVYACLVVKSYFTQVAEEQMAYAGVNYARASLAEIMAMKLLSTFAPNYIELVATLTTSWSPLAGAAPDVVEDVRQVLGGDTDDTLDYPQSALEMAISTKSKEFLSSPVTQKVINDIYSGKVVFSMVATNTVLADNYKPRSIELYNSRAAPFLDHYRLRVPRYGAILEFVNFVFLFTTFVLCLSRPNFSTMTPEEIAFIIFASAFTLAEYTASTEHGWTIYIANIWNVFDTSFVVIFVTYLVLRIKGLVDQDASTSDLAFDILSCGACILFPRLAFFAVSNTVVVLSLRAMISEFIFFIGVAAICFSGLVFTLWTLGKANWTIKGIVWLMVQIWFGNTSLSFGQATSFHPVFGPILMTIYAAMSNTLLLTILISILSNTVARIDANATQEHLFQFAITTIEGVKADALFSYQPPFNVLAFLILKPSSYILSPRSLHSLNVFLIKLTNLPFLLVIGAYERHVTFVKDSGKDGSPSVFRHIKNLPFVEALVGSTSADVYDAIFELESDSGGEEDGRSTAGDGSSYRPLRSINSRETLRRKNPSPSRKRSTSRQPLPLPPSSPGGARLRALSTNVPGGAEIPSLKSPLTRLFSGTKVPSVGDPAAAASMDASLRKMEGMIDDMRDLPVQRLKDEMKDLQERQARIESLLLTLTRGMRNETGTTTSRHDSMRS